MFEHKDIAKLYLIRANGGQIIFFPLRAVLKTLGKLYLAGLETHKSCNLVIVCLFYDLEARGHHRSLNYTDV